MDYKPIWKFNDFPNIHFLVFNNQNGRIWKPSQYKWKPRNDLQLLRRPRQSYLQVIAPGRLAYGGAAAEPGHTKYVKVWNNILSSVTSAGKLSRAAGPPAGTWPFVCVLEVTGGEDQSCNNPKNYCSVSANPDPTFLPVQRTNSSYWPSSSHLCTTFGYTLV